MFGKRGLVNSLLIIIILLFLFAVSSAFAIKIWGDFNEGIQALDSSVADNSTKQQISDLGSFILWGDKLFTYLIITLVVGFLITSFTLPAENSWIIILYFGILSLLTFIAMFISNTWTLANLTFTDFVMRTFPYIVFFVGVTGGLIFYMRARDSSAGVLGGGETF